MLGNMKAEVFDKTANKVGTVELPDRLFARKWNPDLVHQALMIQTSNRRNNVAHAKGRGEVRGGGRKPWRQKGLGRARHGSIRSPIWKGGGVTFGPSKEKNYTKRLNKKMRQGAMFSVFSKKVQDGEMKVIDSFEAKSPKTKELSGTLDKFFEKGQSVLIIPSAGDQNLYKASRNLPQSKSLDPRSINVYDLLKHKNILVEKGAVEEMDKHYHAIK